MTVDFSEPIGLPAVSITSSTGNLNYSFDQLTANLNNIKINDKIEHKVNNILDEIILRDNNLQNRIYLKNLVNKLAKNYAG